MSPFPAPGVFGKYLQLVAEYVNAKAQAGLVGSFKLGICAMQGGGVSVYSTEGCLGGYIEFGWGEDDGVLDKDSLPH